MLLKRIFISTKSGGRNRTRTCDPIDVNDVLSACGQVIKLKSGSEHTPKALEIWAFLCLGVCSPTGCSGCVQLCSRAMDTGVFSCVQGVFTALLCSFFAEHGYGKRPDGYAPPGHICYSVKSRYDVITGKKETSAPVLTINEDKTASFETPGNTSEGSAFKGLVIYDLALLSLRDHCTPALIHDSNILSRVEADFLAPILDQYKKCGYQVFISIDKPKETSPEAQKILFEHPLLQLAAGDGRELYGHSWSKLAQEENASEKDTQSEEGEDTNGQDS